MKAVAVRTLALGVAAALTVGIGALSQVPYEAEAGGHAVIRLAWRIRGVRVEECRQLTQEELDRVPSHMRRTEECEGRTLPYRLQVTLDGRELVDEEVRASGARGDRPLYVFHEQAVAPGAHEIRIQFARQDGDGVDREDLSQLGEKADEPTAQPATPSILEFATSLTLNAREVALITYDAGARQLVLRGYGSR